MQKSVAELLEEVSNADKKDRVAKLREHIKNVTLLKILQWTYDDRIKFLLPEGTPPYNPTKHLDQEGNLYNESRRLYLFVEGGNANLKPVRREFLFIQLLETLSPKEAVLVAHMKDKKLPYKGINKKLVDEAFPGLINGTQIL